MEEELVSSIKPLFTTRHTFFVTWEGSCVSCLSRHDYCSHVFIKQHYVVKLFCWFFFLFFVGVIAQITTLLLLLTITSLTLNDENIFFLEQIMQEKNIICISTNHMTQGYDLGKNLHLFYVSTICCRVGYQIITSFITDN